MRQRKITTKMICFSALSIALATVSANFIKTPSLPFGGSATFFSMLFVALPGFWYGPYVGLIAALAHGIIQFISNPYFIHPVQVLFDYILAFGCLGLSGFFMNKKRGLITGYTVGVLGRFICVCISGVIFYTSYIGVPKADVLAILASIGYNLTYILPEYIITIVLLFLPPVSKALKYVKRIATS